MFQALFFGGRDNLPAFLARTHIPLLDIVVDPCAAVLVLIVTALLCVGIKEVFLLLHHLPLFLLILNFKMAPLVGVALNSKLLRYLLC